MEDSTTTHIALDSHLSLNVCHAKSLTSPYHIRAYIAVNLTTNESVERPEGSYNTIQPYQNL